MSTINVTPPTPEGTAAFRRPPSQSYGSGAPGQASYGGAHAHTSSFSQGPGYTPSTQSFPPNIRVRPGGGGGSAIPALQGTAAGDFVDRVSEYTSKAEDMMDTYSHPVRPYLPGIGRFLIVVTFLEDALRIVTQWGDQIYYLQRHRKFPWGLSHMFLLLNVLVMLACSSAVIGKRYPEYSVIGLLTVVVAQGFGYGLIFDLNFFLRNLSVIGGLLMVLSDSLARSRSSLFAGLPSLDISETDRKKYFQLAGRILLIFLFVGFVINGEFTLARALVSLFGLGACVMVAVGFKAKFSAMFLVMVLSVFNVFINNWWSVSHIHPQRDFLKYDFFQTLSIVGGLILLVNMGPGGISMDEKKKNF